VERAKFLKHPGRSCAESGYGFECPHLVGELGYHIALVRLLSLCSFGRNHKTEVQCRSLLSVNEIQRTYCDDASLPALNVALLSLLEAVYLNTQKAVIGIGVNPKV
jgi:hypothetical protein